MFQMFVSSDSILLQIVDFLRRLFYITVDFLAEHIVLENAKIKLPIRDTINLDTLEK